MRPSLRAILTPLISYVLLFAGTPAADQPSFDELRRKIESLIETQENAIKRYEIPVSDYQDALFAVVAWIDEVILQTHDSNPELYALWSRSTLQAARFRTANAGEEFFERLARLSSTQSEVFEVYYIALCLGFRGRYYDEKQDYRLVEARNLCAKHLPNPVTDLLEFEKGTERLTPQPYSVERPVPKPIPVQVPWNWLIAAGAIAVAALLIFLFWPSGPNPVEIGKVLDSFQCSELKLAGIESGIVKVVGRVDSNDDREELHRRIGNIRGVKGITDDSKVIQRPFCEVIDLLRPFSSPDPSGTGLKIHPSKECDASYLRNESVVLGVTNDKPLKYLYVDYYTADRMNVAHMFPNQYHTDPNLKDSTGYTIGGPNDKSLIVTVSKPFGREMITAISSSTPLFDPPRLEPESDSDYLAQLRGVLQAHQKTINGASYCFMNTAEQ